MDKLRSIRHPSQALKRVAEAEVIKWAERLTLNARDSLSLHDLAQLALDVAFAIAKDGAGELKGADLGWCILPIDTEDDAPPVWSYVAPDKDGRRGIPMTWDDFAFLFPSIDS